MRRGGERGEKGRVYHGTWQGRVVNEMKSRSDPSPFTSSFSFSLFTSIYEGMYQIEGG